MYDPMPGNERRIGPDEVVAKFGVGPERVVDVQSLCGDSTDNVPGVPGIGVKTAAQLIGEFGDLDTLLANAASIKQNMRRERLLRICRSGADEPRARAAEGRCAAGRAAGRRPACAMSSRDR